MSQPGYLIRRITDPAEDMALLDLDDVKAILGIDPGDTSNDAALEILIGSVSDAIRNYCDRQLVVQGYRDQYRGVYLGLYQPIRCFETPLQPADPGTPDVPDLTVSIDGNLLDPAAYEVNFETGEIYLIEGVWSGLVVLEYTAGYEPMPEDLIAVANEWVSERWLARDRDPAVRTETVSDAMTVSYNQASGTSGTDADYLLPPDFVTAGLVTYRRQSV